MSAILEPGFPRSVGLTLDFSQCLPQVLMGNERFPARPKASSFVDTPGGIKMPLRLERIIYENA